MPLSPPTDFWDAVGVWLTTGNAPGWFAVLVAASAAIFAYRSSRASRESADAARQQLLRLSFQDQRELANSFSLWPTEIKQAVTWEVAAAGGDVIPRPIDKVYHLRFELNNPGNSSTFAVRPYVVGEEGREYRLGYIDQVPPQNRGPLRWEAYACIAYRVAPADANSLIVGAIFLDARQQWWDRTPAGDIVPLDSQEVERRQKKMHVNRLEVEEKVDWRGEDDVRRRVGESNPVH